MHWWIAGPVTAFMAIRSYRRKSLTPLGIAAAVVTAAAHAVHPWSVFFALLIVFFIGGTSATKVKHEVKATLTLSSSGSSGGEGARSSIQVFANSGVASVLILLHAWKTWNSDGAICWEKGVDPLVVGIIANYAAVAADTFSSELGILSKRKPRLITSFMLKEVPKGTNGGVTGTGLLAGLLGASIIALTTLILLPFCAEPGSFSTWTLQDRAVLFVIITLWGGLGSVLDSILGALLQASVVDVRSGKVVEGSGGNKVLIRPSDIHDAHHSLKSTAEDVSILAAQGSPSGRNLRSRQKAKAEDSPATTASQSGTVSRKIEAGRDILDNNQVNVSMAFIMSVSAVFAYASFYGVPLNQIL